MSEPENFIQWWDYLQEVRRELTIMLGHGWIVRTRQTKCSADPNHAWMVLAISRHTRHGIKGLATGYEISPDPEQREIPLLLAKDVATKIAAEWPRKIERWLERVDEAQALETAA